MRALVGFFQDNAMFYKDITQWLRNRTFASLFFGLLLVAEVMSLFIIAGSDDISNPGVSMFYTLYMVLIIYAMVIAYLGNNLTSREFVNRTFELFELSGMSLELMVGGKLLSMLYQFLFGFSCLVPFMFFAYFLGGLDFFEMVVGVVMIGFLALPLYLFSLMTALSGRFKQVSLLMRLVSIFLLGMFTLSAIISFFSDEPLLQFFVRALTDFFKGLLSGAPNSLTIFLTTLAVYVQVCLLLFYFCCDSISRESDSREIPIKVLIATLFMSWMGLFGILITVRGYDKGDAYGMVVPVFLTLLALGVRTYYSRASVPPIVALRYRGASGLKRLFYAIFKPGIEGSVRTLFLLIILAIATGQIAISLVGGLLLGGSDIATQEWWTSMSLLVQTPWFLAVPHIFYARARAVRYNYATQRTFAVTVWVVLGSIVLVYLAWTRSGIYGSAYGGSRDLSTWFDIVLVTLLSPLPSLSVVGSDDFVVQQAGSFLRLFSGIVGGFLMYFHMRNVVRDEAAMIENARIGVMEGGENVAAGGQAGQTEDGPELPADGDSESL